MARQQYGKRRRIPAPVGPRPYQPGMPRGGSFDIERIWPGGTPPWIHDERGGGSPFPTQLLPPQLQLPMPEKFPGGSMRGDFPLRGPTDGRMPFAGIGAQVITNRTKNKKKRRYGPRRFGQMPGPGGR